MRNKLLLRQAAVVIAMILPAMVHAANTTKPAKPVASNLGRSADAPLSGSTSFNWSARTGLGFDSNAFEAPRSPYIDYAAGNVLITPQKKSGFFVPFEIGADATQTQTQDSKLIASATAGGSIYPGGRLNEANEYNLRLSGGFEQVLQRKNKSENTLYFGALAAKRKQIYVDHDSGLNKTTTLSGVDISNRYSYLNLGVEAEYKHGIGDVNYGLIGKFIIYDYDDPIAVSQLDHDYYRVGAEADFPVARSSTAKVSLDHTVRDYSNRHSRNAQGSILNANPLARFTYDAIGASLRHRMSDPWLLYLDLDHTQRSDGYVGYDNYRETRFGGRLLYALGRIKSKLSLHHWVRDYPNGFAFDAPGRGAKNYSGNDVKFKTEIEQAKNTAYWAELVYDAQSATDLRYDYTRTQIMGGMSWAY